MPSPPPGVSSADFSSALGKFADAVGSEWVFKTDEDVAVYRDAYSPLWNEPTERLASAAVAPSSVEQVQRIVQIANQHRIPLYPISTGRNLGYGGSAPIHSGSVVVDLKRMNRVLAVNEKRAFALVEPGVSYFDLYRHIQEHKLKVWLDVPDPGWGSVMGNALDHGVGYTFGPFRDHFGSHCGMEVVLPNGEVMRTGMGALPKSDSWQDYRYGFGPYVDGLFGQGNFGIVTKMGFWLMPEPDAMQYATITVPRRKDLIPLVDHINYLEDASLIGQPQFGSPMFPFGGGGPPKPPDPALMSMMMKPGGPSDEEIDSYASKKGSGVWSVVIKSYGPLQTVAANLAYARDRITAAIPGTRYEEGKLFRFPMSDADKKAQLPSKTAVGMPSLEAFSIGARSEMNPNPSDGHLWFAAIIPRTGEAVLEFQRVMTPLSQGQGTGNVLFGGYLQTPSCWHQRTFIMITGFPISRSNKELNARTRGLFEKVVTLAAENGWGEYRSPPAFADLIMKAYGYNNHALRRFCETLKDGADPNGIIAAGRGGIWPKHLRAGRKV